MTKTEVLMQRLMDELQPILSLLSGFIDEGVQIARQFFENQQSPQNPWLFSHLVRWHICRRLDAYRDEITVPYQRIDYPLSGVEVFYEGRRIKIFKSTDGQLPAAGRSV